MRKGGAKLTGRPLNEWLVRASLAVATLVIASISVADTIANVVVKLDPTRANALAPYDGKITAALAEHHLNMSTKSNSDFTPAQLARLALIQDPTAVEALTVLGLQAQLAQKSQHARQLFSLSDRLTRRTLETRVWAIEDAVQHGDVAAALRNYDIALRTKKSAPNLLYPILASAISEPTVRSSLIQMMAMKPRWRQDFINYLASAGTNPAATASFFSDGASVELPVDDGNRSRVVNALIDKGSFEEAWTYYTSFRTDSDRQHSRSPDLSQDADAISYFDWVPVNANGASVAIQKERDGGVVRFAVPPSTGGILLSQLQMLRPGTYALEGRAIGIEQPDRTLPYWSLTCQDGRELGRIIIPNSAEGDGSYQGRFEVPSGCMAQTLALVARYSDQIGGLSGELTRVKLAPSN